VQPALPAASLPAARVHNARPPCCIAPCCWATHGVTLQGGLRAGGVRQHAPRLPDAWPLQVHDSATRAHVVHTSATRFCPGLSQLLCIHCLVLWTPFTLANCLASPGKVHDSATRGRATAQASPDSSASSPMNHCLVPWTA
jgi:hypothetical protein